MWLKPSEYAGKQRKALRTIQLWCKTGFIAELGFILYRDVTGHYMIGIPPDHPNFAQFT